MGANCKLSPDVENRVFTLRISDHSKLSESPVKEGQALYISIELFTTDLVFINRAF